MIYKRILFLALSFFCLWLALATRKYTNFFHPFIIEFGGDVLWAAGFMFILRAIFLKYNLVKLSIVCYVLGAVNELLQLYQAHWIQSIRATYIGRLMLGVGFVATDFVCYLLGTLIAFVIIWFIEVKTNLGTNRN